MTEPGPASDELKAQRLPIIKRIATANKKRESMRVYWEQRRAQLREFESDDDIDTAGSPDVELAELPESFDR